MLLIVVSSLTNWQNSHWNRCVWSHCLPSLHSYWPRPVVDLVTIGLVSQARSHVHSVLRCERWSLVYYSRLYRDVLEEAERHSPSIQPMHHRRHEQTPSETLAVAADEGRCCRRLYFSRPSKLHSQWSERMHSMEDPMSDEHHRPVSTEKRSKILVPEELARSQSNV